MSHQPILPTLVIARANRSARSTDARRLCAVRLYVGSRQRFSACVHDALLPSTQCARIRLGRRKIDLSMVLPARMSVARKLAIESGWSASWTTTWGSSTTRPVGSELPRTPSPQTYLSAQWVIETLVLSICAGVFQCRVSLGRVFNFLATVSNWAW